VKPVANPDREARPSGRVENDVLTPILPPPSRPLLDVVNLLALPKDNNNRNNDNNNTQRKSKYDHTKSLLCKREESYLKLVLDIFVSFGMKFRPSLGWCKFFNYQIIEVAGL
jgi:hypothetical protein